MSKIVLIEKYKLELRELKSKMIKAQKFADEIPLFSEEILTLKYSGKEHWIKFGETYKNLYLAWGINRGFFDSESNRNISNYREHHQEYLFCIYINSCSLFDCHHNFDLYESLKDVNIFFSDVLNTKFYVTDENIEPFLEALNKWYLKAKDENNLLRQQERIKIAQDEIKKAEEIIFKEHGVK